MEKHTHSHSHFHSHSHSRSTCITHSWNRPISDWLQLTLGPSVLSLQILNMDHPIAVSLLLLPFLLKLVKCYTVYPYNELIDRIKLLASYTTNKTQQH